MVSDSMEGKPLTDEEFYQKARRWAAVVRNRAKARALSFDKGKKGQGHTYKSGAKAGKLEKKLSESVRFKVERDGKVPSCVGFMIPIHGIYREWAVGYGQPRVQGKYVARHSRVKRTMADWLDEPISMDAEQLFDLAAEYWGDRCLVNFFGTKKN